MNLNSINISTVGVVLVVLCVICVCNGQYETPLQRHLDLAKSVRIEASQTCSSDHPRMYTCHTATCESRTTTPPTLLHLTSSGIPDSCKIETLSGLPSHVPSGNSIFINNTNQDSCTVSKSTGRTSGSRYTVSFWIKRNCGTCEILKFTYGSDAKVIYISVGSNLLQFNSTSYSNHAVSAGTWHHVSFRKTALFIDGAKSTVTDFGNSMNVVPSSINIETSGLTSSENIEIADLRIYETILTDREVTKIFTNRFTPTLRESDACRCPSDNPALTDVNDPQGMMCKSDTGSSVINRLDPGSHVAGFANDGVHSSTWISGPSDDVTLTLTLDNIVQIVVLNITFGTKPDKITITLQTPGGHSRVLMYTSDDISSNNVLSASLLSEITAISNRSELEDTLAQTVTLRFQGHDVNLEDSYYLVNEVVIDGRCNCNGNSATCSRPLGGRKFTCTGCDKQTTGSSCENCRTGYYRGPFDFGCPNRCGCNAGGTRAGVVSECEQLGGQCGCKSNVKGRTCDTCKRLAYNFDPSNPDGCSPCLCDVNGTKSCDSVNGECLCKNNNFATTSCSECKPRYYGRNKPEGCVPCGCSEAGVMNGNLNCHEFTGQCSCKPKVTGVQCERCHDGYYKLDRFNSVGCSPCKCNTVGSVNQTCDQASGHCPCHIIEASVPNPQCNPYIKKIEPLYGPLSGGTQVEVGGLLFGSDRTIISVIFNMKDKHIQLPVQLINDSTLLFTTPNVNTTGNGNVTIQWKQTLSTTGSSNLEDKTINYPFEVKLDPEITKAEQVKTFKSFGCGIKIQGVNLDSVHRPILIVYLGGNETKTKECETPTKTEVKCGVPDLSSMGNKEVLRYGLILDGVDRYKELFNMFPSATIEVIDDPDIKPFGDVEEIRFPFIKAISVKGTGFDNACDKSRDFEITLEKSAFKCPITSISNTEIQCEPDVTFPGTGETLNVTLRIGEKSYHVGKVKMMIFWKTIEFIGIAAGAGALILIIIILCVVIKCCCCKKREQRKEFTDISQVSEGNAILLGVNKSPSNVNDLATTAHENSGYNTCDEHEMNEKPRIVSRYTPMPDPAQNQPEADNSTNVKEDFLHQLESNVRNELQLSWIKKSDIEIVKPVRCPKKGTDIRIIDGRYSSRKSTMKTLIKPLTTYGESDPFKHLMQNGLSECMKLRDCFHENILPIYGFSVDQERFYIVYPATRRILKDHLNDIKGQTFQVVDLIRMSREIAEGMAFLHNDMKIVHKDLATRNCFVTDDSTVKICDGSFSWDLFPKEYMYDHRKERYIPVRWMAPECLTSGFYDRKTDVWSLGVIMWEMMSRSIGLPYWDMKDDSRISSHVLDGNRLGKPAETPENMYQLMLQCWQNDSNLRPDMDNVANQLVNIENPEDPGIYQNIQPDSMGPPPSLPPRADQVYGNIP